MLVSGEREGERRVVADVDEKKPIPLDAPTEVEVGPGRTVRVTLIDVSWLR